MEVAPSINFDFNSSPHGGAYYTSAPSSPNRLTELYCEFDELFIGAGAARGGSLAAVPFAWEEKPGVPKTPNNLFEDDFSFDVSCDFSTDPVAAEDLFHGGVIKTGGGTTPLRLEERKAERGRERGFSSSSRLPSRRTRSLSPIGVSNYRREQPLPMMATTTNTKPPSAAAGCSSENGSKRWSFKDLFLFRSASDGRAMDKDPFKKYTSVFKKTDQDFKNSCEPGSMSKRRVRGSAHEVHYNLNRANSNEMKKKTYLPYRNGILGGW